MRAPAVPHYFQMEAWRPAQIGFKGEGFVLMAPAAYQPLNRQRPWPELHDHARVFEPSRGEIQTSVQTRASLPTRVEDASLAGARSLHPAQSGRPFFPIVGGKHYVPQSQDGD